ncbi:2,3-bisphosphoglycerate-independent phosphoglycerate mutase [Thermotomaculum hydrothermale]|uniref:2,3-bisphosphoglycerate-independent phosphoglycerate mutase n=2 Tax=Thermotomaculum hydrothermale TaxID=981385 RepID=A0A7R6PXZ9_9BACT|nr:2,3-bisphosphoglycerate-independent phosphoglycerate mutase [Thermotomaculum hydrothermale]BBB32855.1 2,3-bisphosphoglycerate-independent phosphoglycerate mutase [Thermotomaculum hydrothermale]
MKERVILTIMDGFGLSEQEYGNAVKAAKTPNLFKLFTTYPFSKLKASGLAVGLPEGQMGNSEVGHLNIGAGRVVYQDITRINKAIENGRFFENKTLKQAFIKSKEKGKRVHLFGLVSDGGVHSHINHLKALIQMGRETKQEHIVIHCFTDGRDTPPDSGIEYIKELENFLKRMGFGEIGTVSGRYYAMDRDKRWERIKLAYDNIVFGKAPEFEKASDGIKKAYENGETDEFIKPFKVKGYREIEEGDAVIFFNFRADRVRQICHAFLDKEFPHFERKLINFSDFVTFTEYEEGLPVKIAFPPERLINIFGEVISKHGLKQLRIAETEKYAHVTFFFNGGEEKKFEGEDRILVPSPKVATYDLKPEMSAFEVTEKVLDAINNNKYDVIILNFANCDMVGHTGVFEAAVKAVETVDQCVGKVADAVLKNNWHMLLTADHGNAEKMYDEEGNPFTAHTTNPVPFCLISEKYKGRRVKNGALKDLAPTMLEILGIEKPEEMTGESLIKK